MDQHEKKESQLNSVVETMNKRKTTKNTVIKFRSKIVTRAVREIPSGVASLVAIGNIKVVLKPT